MKENEIEELKHWIAVHVFNWKRVGLSGERQWVNSNGVYHESTPDYPRDKAAAFEVFLKLKELGWHCSIQTHTNGTDCDVNNFLCSAERDDLYAYYESNDKCWMVALCKLARQLFAKEGVSK